MWLSDVEISRLGFSGSFINKIISFTNKENLISSFTIFILLVCVLSQVWVPVDLLKGRLSNTLRIRLALQLQETSASQNWRVFLLPRAFLCFSIFTMHPVDFHMLQTTWMKLLKYNAKFKFSIHQVPPFSRLPEPSFV